MILNSRRNTKKHLKQKSKLLCDFDKPTLYFGIVTKKQPCTGAACEIWLLLVLFNGFKKKTRKAPKMEIEKAERLMKEYFQSKE